MTPLLSRAKKLHGFGGMIETQGPKHVLTLLWHEDHFETYYAIRRGLLGEPILAVRVKQLDRQTWTRTLADYHRERESQ